MAMLPIFADMKSHLLGFIIAFFGLVIAAITLIVPGKDNSKFFISAPFAAYLTGNITRKLLVKQSYSWIKVISVGFISGVLSHYPCRLLTTIGFSNCYHLTGSCTGSFGNLPSLE